MLAILICFCTELKKDLVSVLDKTSKGIDEITIDYLFTSHIRAGFNSVIEEINNVTYYEIQDIFNNENITDEDKFEIKYNKTCTSSSFCDDIESFFGLENPDQFKKKALGAFLKHVNQKMFDNLKSVEFFGKKNNLIINKGKCLS